MMTEAIETIDQVKKLPAIFEGETKLPKLNRYDEGQAQIFVMARIVNGIMKYFKPISETIEVVEIELLSELFFDEYSGLRLNEIDLIFREAAKGKYGATYEKLTTQRIMGWALKYTKGREKYLESARHKKYLQQKKNPLCVPPPKHILEAMQKRREDEKDTHLNHNARKLKRQLG